MKIENIKAGESWGCRFRVRTFVDDEGKPVDTTNIQIGDTVPGKPGDYEGFGVIAKRDNEKQLVEIIDQDMEDKTWVVHWNDCWAVDRVEFAD